MIVSPRNENSSELQQVIDWINDKTLTRKAKYFGIFGFFLAILTAPLYLVLGENFADRFSIPKIAAYIFSILSAFPITLLVAQKCQEKFRSILIPQSPYLSDIVNYHYSEERKSFLIFLRKFFLFFLALTITIPMVGLTHEEISKKASSSIVIPSDILMFITRIVLFNWSVNNFYNLVKEIINKYKSKFDELSNEVTNQRKAVRSHIDAALSIIQKLDSEKIEELHNTVFDGNQFTLEKLNEFFKLPINFPQLIDKNKYLSQCIWLFGLVNGLAGSYVMKVISERTYGSIFTYIGASQSLTNVMATALAWLSMLCFSTLTSYAVILALKNFYIAIVRSKFIFRKRQQDNTTLKIYLTVFSTVSAFILSLLSSFPRIEVNLELLNNFTLWIQYFLGCGTAVSFFSLDYWPLNGIMQRLLKVNNQREMLSTPLGKLNKVMPSLDYPYVNGLFSQINSAQEVRQRSVTVNSDEISRLLRSST